MIAEISYKRQNLRLLDQRCKIKSIKCIHNFLNFMILNERDLFECMSGILHGRLL